MQVKTFHLSGFHRLATSRKSRRLFATVLVMGCAALAGVTSQTALAQEADTSPAVRDTFSISSAYFENNYANNIDYSQFEMDVETAAGRLVLYGNDKLSDYVNGSVSRVLYLLGSTVLMDISGISITYHEWGHASRAAAICLAIKLREGPSVHHRSILDTRRWTRSAAPQ